MELFSGHLLHILGGAALMGLLVFGLIGILVRFDKRGKSSQSRGNRPGFESGVAGTLPAARRHRKRRSKK